VQRKNRPELLSMKTAHAPLAYPMKILRRTELAEVLAALNRKAPRLNEVQDQEGVD